MTVGSDCARCHNSENWLVDNITELHFDNGFPLLGVHATATCFECHTSETAVRFDRIGNDCINCHLDEFQATTNPDHQAAGFSTNCIECHDLENPDWGTETVDHSFFPLTKGHEVNECAQCHVGGDFANTSPDCFSCHQTDFTATTSPDHELANFVTDCAACHTTDIGWMPAEYLAHDTEYFPIYSGAHQGTWDECASCHTDASDYAVFSCTVCHANPETDDAHNGVSGYAYENSACLACHPTGTSDGSFDHDATNFTLTGAHIGVDCIACHANGYAGTPTDCAACHTVDFQNTINPDHEVLTFSTDCATCHSTEPDWMPATFANHDDYYILKGAHAAIANDCAACHNGDYNNTPTDCVGCHQLDYDNSTNPSHTAVQFPTDCAVCHTEDDWSLTTYDHDGEYFPIYSGSHLGVWDQCVECHTNPSNYAEHTCVTCHENPETDNQHVGVNGYSYNTPACFACHPTGEADDIFDHNLTAFPLTGAHLTTDCLECHAAGFAGTPTDCAACHQMDFDGTLNPNHNSLGLSTDCASCHTTEPDWMPATFANHDDYYQLNGAHATFANDCATCHNGDYNNTPNDCFGCHAADYNATTNPPHVDLQFSTDCLECHTENEWSPATFDHDTQHFPIYSGAHNGEWNACVDCHTNSSNYKEFTCVACHLNPETDDAHVSVGGYIYENTACLACHPTGDATNVFDHNNTNFPLTGEHLQVDCIDCHSGGYVGTPTDCAACHQMDYTQTINPNHVAIGISNDCASCHTTEPDWNPATFANHDDYYQLNGAHLTIANDCATCHNGDYNNTPNTCVGCHQADFNGTTNPDHQAAQFGSDCTECHSEDAWSPSSFDHDNIYPLNGAHGLIANDCAQCHANNNFANTPTECIGCHQADFDNTSNPNHASAQFSTDCTICHSENEWVPANFDHDAQYFPIYSGAHEGEWDQCLDCHTNPNNYMEVTCIVCHANPETDNEHAGVNGYVYENTACLACHPTGDADNIFDHNTTNFPLTGEHVVTDCIDCHSAGYAGTPTECSACHQMDYDGTTNPNHVALGLPTDCASCHTTDPDWMPAVFPDHDNYYQLNGAHLAIANDCAACHNGNYNNTPNTCVGCHQADYDNTTNPNHAAAQFSTDCVSCHSEEEWMPATFDHDAQYFPIYSGAHNGEWDQCVDCHTNPNNYAEFSCTTCHMNPETDNAHVGVNGYSYNSSACFACHPTGSADDNFDHNLTGFPLTGAHITAECIECHANGYQGTPTDCAACHQTDYNQTTNPDHDGIGISTDCIACHTTDPGWSPATFAIHDNYFVLDGAHLTVANDCAACHNGNYNNTPNTCAGCHTSDYNASTNPDHQALGIPTDCATCHTTEPDWEPATFAIHNNYYMLNGAHAAIANDCAACHNGNYNNTPNTCFGCHADDYNQTTNPDHQAAQFPTDCVQCHNEDEWTPASFDHNNFYPLTGAHETIENDCVLCHVGGNYNNTPNTCVGCHQGDFDQTTNPNHPALGLPTDCNTCHTTEPDWMPATFAIHDNYYQLNGTHATIANDCAACHNGNYNNTPNTCFGCHADDYNNTTNPNHQTLQFSNDCTECHNENAWSPANFDHNSIYPLTGAHAVIANDCALCHINGNYSNTPNTCVGCHQSDYDQSVNPNHVALGLPTDCESCHTTDPGWDPALFPNHDNYWVLDGAHLAVANDCVGCHNGNYNNTPTTCVGCHQADYDQSVDPNHVALGLPTDCESCHTTQADWMPATFAIHDNYWVIDGAHSAIANDCVECHNGSYNNTPNTCVGCHQADYNASINPNHSALGIPTDCESCHTTQADWMPATFPIHDNYWVIDGAHSAIASDCFECHNGNYNNTPNTCVGCHQSDYDQTTNPNHQAIGIPTDCMNCHTTDPDWMPATFPIHDNYWQLNGAHALIANDCAMCHNGNYNNTPNTCYGCHADDYNQTTNPNHSAASFPTDCQSCHDESAWVPASFDHTVFYPLTGAHATIANDCALCHIGGNYSNTPNTCEGCHQPDYNASTNPNHVALAIPMDCAMCHTTDPDWMPATFPIHNNYYQLNGAHAIIQNDCAACHNGNYSNTPNTCFGCHEDDYNGTNNPNHSSAGFPTTCDDCHSETAWTPSTWDHDNQYFPIYSGKHKNEWNNCNECHTTPGNYAAFSCIDCHEHDDPVELADDHQGVSGYSYSSPACYSCHPTGED
jgi:hypothetical protein